MKPIAIVLTALFFGFYLRRKMGDEPELQDKLSNGAGPSGHTWDHILDQYGIPFGQFCVATIYSVYMNLTAMNMLVFVVKYIPTGLCMYNFVKGIYVTSRDRQRRQQLEFEDIQLQITIINTKLCVREAECAELTGALRREAARLRGVRARVREAIAADAALAPRDRDRRPVAEDPDLTELLKELKYDQVALAECHNDMLECGEHAQGESPEHSVYSSLSDPDVDKECRVKIVKVTNVYKVAYLKHYIKQKRLRRASKQALLKKKMESIKKLLEDWQRSLNMVINSRLSLLRADDTSEEAAGDHSKPRDSDSDNELRAADCYDEYNANWLQPPYRSYYEEPETAVSRDSFEHEYGDQQCECAGPKGGHVLFLLPRLPEETSSQVAIDDIHDDCDHDGFLTV
ncbi:uncharacterized protein isoform X1 [Choristoneura fumiferana]|uniref:uncharacterized protein isoform X1 n=1 Tax=Choristoneura fumiferana TaxID=7141 RepID=UPI003D15EB2B